MIAYDIPSLALKMANTHSRKINLYILLFHSTIETLLGDHTAATKKEIKHDSCVTGVKQQK